jgi:pimeloyl-[acyl-carrier protein] methyl ester esterase
MYVQDIGRGRPLIFLHGWSSHGGYFAPQVEQLAVSHRLLLPDLPGHRHSAADLDALTIAGIADRLHRVIFDQDLQGAVLIGWSMGAMVAFDYIQRYGTAALSGLVIEDMTVRITNAPDWRFGIRNGFDLAQSNVALEAMRSDWPAYALQALPRLFARDHSLPRETMSWISEDIARNDGAVMAALWASMANQDYRDLLPTLSLPVLVIHGGESQLYESAVSQWVAANIRHARRICIDQAGHSPHLEAPDVFNRALIDFITWL